MLRLGVSTHVFLLNHPASYWREAVADGMFYIEGFPGDESDMICPQHAHPFFVFAWDIEDTSFHSGFRHFRRLWTDIIYDHDNPVFFFLLDCESLLCFSTWAASSRRSSGYRAGYCWADWVLWG